MSSASRLEQLDSLVSYRPLALRARFGGAFSVQSDEEEKQRRSNSNLHRCAALARN